MAYVFPCLLSQNSAPLRHGERFASIMMLVSKEASRLTASCQALFIQNPHFNNPTLSSDSF
ncbi:MAG TPA: hypothetical protein DEB70_07085 [Planctomycetaceae bacterium]|nr:hypothetical protein [Planctomycetaceae bacterium]